MSEKTPPVCNYEGSDYQQSFWEQGDRAYEDAAEEIALRKLLPYEGGNLLELGAGAGRNTPRYKGFKQITLVDYSFTQLEQAQQCLGDSQAYKFVAADIYNLPFNANRFDAATMIRTLHHMKDAPHALRQVRSCLKPGAVFILEYANKMNLKAIFRYVLGKQRWNPFSKDPVEFAELNFDFHPSAIREWLAHAGFKLDRQLTVSHFRIGFLKRLLPAKFLAVVDGFVSPTGNLWQLTPSVFTRSTAVGEESVTQTGFFRCPACGHNDLPDTPPELVCPACGRRYPVTNGVYDLRVK